MFFLVCLCQTVQFRKVRWPLVGIQKKKMVVISYEGEKANFSVGLCSSLPQKMCSDELWGSRFKAKV